MDKHLRHDRNPPDNLPTLFDKAEKTPPSKGAKKSKKSKDSLPDNGDDPLPVRRNLNADKDEEDKVPWWIEKD